MDYEKLLKKMSRKKINIQEANYEKLVKKMSRKYLQRKCQEKRIRTKNELRNIS